MIRIKAITLPGTVVVLKVDVVVGTVVFPKTTSVEVALPLPPVIIEIAV